MVSRMFSRSFLILSSSHVVHSHKIFLLHPIINTFFPPQEQHACLNLSVIKCLTAGIKTEQISSLSIPRET